MRASELAWTDGRNISAECDLIREFGECSKKGKPFSLIFCFLNINWTLKSKVWFEFLRSYFIHIVSKYFKDVKYKDLWKNTPYSDWYKIQN